MSNSLQLIIGVMSSLVLFLYGLESLSNELLTLNSHRFRTFISKITQNRFVGVLIGIVGSAIVQSRSTIISMTMSFVSSSLITFKNSLGIVLGSNIGIALASQLVFVNTRLLAPILITIGFVLKIMGGKTKIISKPIFFTGVIIFALQLLSSNISVLGSNDVFISMLSNFDNLVFAFVITAIVTGIIHSSTVILGTVLILVQANLIPMEVAIVMILGTNLGSTISVLFSSLQLDTYAKKTAISNMFFCLFGTSIVLIFFKHFSNWITYLPYDQAQQIGVANLLFNIGNTLIFLPLLTPFTTLIEKLFPSKDEEIQFKTKYITDGNNTDVLLQVEAIKKELISAINNTQKIFGYAMRVFYKPAKLTLMQIEKLELYNDFLDDEITLANIKLIKDASTEKIATDTVNTIRISNAIEQLGDLGKDLKDVFVKMHQKSIPQITVDISSICQIEKEFEALLDMLKVVIQKDGKKNIEKLKDFETKVHRNIEKHLDGHVNKILEKKGYVGSVFVDSISILELSVAKVREVRKILE